MKTTAKTGVIIALVGARQSGRHTTLEALRRRLPHSLYVKSVTTREYAEDDPRREIYDTIPMLGFKILSIGGKLVTDALHAALGEAAHERFGIMRETIDAVLENDVIGITVLNLDAVQSLMAYLKSKDALARCLPIFLSTPPEAVYRARLTKRGLTDEEIDRQIARAASLEARARESGIPFVFIENIGDDEADTRDEKANATAIRIVDALQRHRRVNRL